MFGTNICAKSWRGFTETLALDEKIDISEVCRIHPHLANLAAHPTVDELFQFGQRAVVQQTISSIHPFSHLIFQITLERTSLI